MIVYGEETSWLVVTQPDHAHFAGELLALWRGDGLPEHPRRDDILFAAREHDNGWREADAAPRWDGERGRPHDFLSMPWGDRVAIWERGTARFAGSRPYAALLIVRHAWNLHRSHPAPERAELLSYLEELQEGLLGEVEGGEAELAADYRFVDLADSISLTACSHWREPFEHAGVRGRFMDGTMCLDPFPLAGATTFTVPCRRIPRRAYRGDADLGGELAAARWGEMRVRVARWGEA